MPTWVNIARSETTTVSVVPQLMSANLGESFSVDVAAKGVIDLYAWELELNWSASLLDTVTVTEGAFLKSGGSTFFIYRLDNALGHILIDCTLMGRIPWNQWWRGFGNRNISRLGRRGDSFRPTR